MIYNFTVADFHTYFVGEAAVWVHNTNCGTGGRKSGVPDGDFVPNPNVSTKYSRPSSAGPTAEQKRSVQGKPCVDCETVTPKQVADHKDPLVVQYYREGSVDVAAQRTVEAVQPHCPTCSSSQGGQLGAFGRKMKKLLGIK